MLDLITLNQLILYKCSGWSYPSIPDIVISLDAQFKLSLFLKDTAISRNMFSSTLDNTKPAKITFKFLRMKITLALSKSKPNLNENCT